MNAPLLRPRPRLRLRASTTACLPQARAIIPVSSGTKVLYTYHCTINCILLTATHHRDQNTRATKCKQAQHKEANCCVPPCTYVCMYPGSKTMIPLFFSLSHTPPLTATPLPCRA